MCRFHFINPKCILCKVDRVELCSALGIGGLTPSYGLIREASIKLLPIHCLIRPGRAFFLYKEKLKLSKKTY